MSFEENVTAMLRSSYSFKSHTHRDKSSTPPFLFKTLKCIQTPSPESNPSSSPLKKPISQNPTSSLSCWAVTSSPPRTIELSSCKLQRLVSEFQSLSEPIDRVKRLLHYASLLPPLDESARITENQVMGCIAQVWLEAKMDVEGRMRFMADSDSEITRGFCSCLVWVLDGSAPEEVLKLKTEDLAALNVGLPGGAQSRVNTWHNVLISMQKRTKALVAEREGKPKFEPFPSLVVTADGIHAKGSYAEAQARFLFPDESKVEELVNVLKEKKNRHRCTFLHGPRGPRDLNCCKEALASYLYI